MFVPAGGTYTEFFKCSITIITCWWWKQDKYKI